MENLRDTAGNREEEEKTRLSRMLVHFFTGEMLS